MDTIGPTEFQSVTGLSAKALRLYEDRGLLSPSSTEPATGYRRYNQAEVVLATRIALLRRAGLSLAEIARFLAAPSRSTIEAWLKTIEAERSERRNALRALADALGLGEPHEERKTMTVTIRTVGSLDELADAFDVAGAQFGCDPLIWPHLGRF